MWHKVPTQQRVFYIIHWPKRKKQKINKRMKQTNIETDKLKQQEKRKETDKQTNTRKIKIKKVEKECETNIHEQDRNKQTNKRINKA